MALSSLGSHVPYGIWNAHGPRMAKLSDFDRPSMVEMRHLDIAAHLNIACNFAGTNIRILPAVPGFAYWNLP